MVATNAYTTQHNLRLGHTVAAADIHRTYSIVSKQRDKLQSRSE
jgi:hypothetical protein